MSHVDWEDKDWMAAKEASKVARDKRRKMKDTYVDPTDIGGTDPENWWAEQVLKTYVSPDKAKSRNSPILGVTPPKNIEQEMINEILQQADRRQGVARYAYPGAKPEEDDTLPWWGNGWKTIKTVFGDEKEYLTQQLTGRGGELPMDETDEMMAVAGAGILPPWLLVILAAIAPYAIDAGVGLVKESVGDWTETVVSKLFGGDTKWAVYSRNKLITIFSDAGALDDYLDSLAQDLKKTVRVREIGA